MPCFWLSSHGATHAFAVEIDLGHTSSAEFARKLEIHALYATHDLFQKRYVPKDSDSYRDHHTPAP